MSAPTSAPLRHHDLCFGCGLANVFGLNLDARFDGERLRGRCFVKQDHQGPPGLAHGGVVAAALEEAMALRLHAEGVPAQARRFEVEHLAGAPVGTFLEVVARVERREGPHLWLAAEAGGEPGRLATARGVFVTGALG